jgi:hypothetical protein
VAEHFHAVSGLIQAQGTGVNGTFAIPEMIVVADIGRARSSIDEDIPALNAKLFALGYGAVWRK